VQCTMWDVPHILPEVRDAILASIPPYQRDARSKGIPHHGSGVIYPVPEADITVKPFAIPDNWPKVYALDVGWRRTAALWAARNPENGNIYLYDEHYQGREEPSIHAAAVRARGEWITGVIDPAARGRSQKDGAELMQAYVDLGLNVTPSKNAVEAGITLVWQALVGGRLKVFSSLQHFLQEFRLYRRDENGKIVKENDHLMDCVRYLYLSGRDMMATKLPKPGPSPIEYGYLSSGSWMS
jgi:hypothetical protein